MAIPPKRTVVISIVGNRLDAGLGVDRWNSWRPTLSIVQQEDLIVHRLELLYDKSSLRVLDRLSADVRSVSPETVVRAHALEFDNPWDLAEVYGALHDFARSYEFDLENEEYLVHITTGTHVAQICLFLLTEARYLPARLLQTSPPGRSKHHRDPGTYATIDLDLSRYDRIAERFELEHKEAASVLKSGIPTRNEAFNRLIQQIEQVGLASKDPILLTGPTGAGKSRLARRLYDLKKQRHQLEGPLIEVNCATLRGDQAMSTLFGHVRGAFTGADRERPGLLRSADGGLLFLDEVGELGLDEQAMLLHALEEQRFLPVGADREVSSDFQLIVGTNRDLQDAVREGRFRDDLLARIDLWTFRLPALSERREDIRPNVEYELEQFAQRASRRVRFNKEALTRYLAFATSSTAAWKGNFRDLNASVTRMATLADTGRIAVEHVDEEIQRLTRSWGKSSNGSTSESDARELALPTEVTEELDLFDRLQLEAVVRVCREHDSLSSAGRTLFAQSRQKKQNPNDADRLRKFLARFGLTFADITSPQT